MLSFQQFCGGKFWDNNVTVNTNNPDFTSCFEATILSWTPLLVFLGLSPLLIYQFLKSRTAALPLRPLLIVKLIISACMLLGSTLTVIGTFVNFDSLRDNHGESTADVVSSVLNWILAILVLLSLIFCRKQGIISSGVIFITLSLLCVCGIFEFRTRILEFNSKNFNSTNASIFLFVCHSVTYTLALTLLLLSCFADKPHQSTYILKKQPCPEIFASFLNRITYSYFLPVAINGYRRTLDYADLWELEIENSSKYLESKWNKYWRKKATNYQEKRKKAILKFNESKRLATISDSDKSNLLQPRSKNYGSISSGCHTKTASQKSEKQPLSFLTNFLGYHKNRSIPTVKLPMQPSMTIAMFQCIWTLFVPAVILNLIADVLQFLSPQLLSYIINFVQDQNEPQWHGYIFAGGIFVAACLNTLFNQAMFHCMFTISVHIKAILTDAIYQKTMRLSNTSKQGYTTGELVNRMSVDAQRITWEVPFMTAIISCPFKIGLATYFLYQQLGPSIFASIGVLVLVFPINSCLFRGLEWNQIKQMGIKDERLKMLTETLNSIKVLKLYAWEEPFENQISKIRKREVKTIQNVANCNSGFQLMWEAAPFLMTAVSFMTFIILDPINNVLTPQVAFVSLSLFNLLTDPLGVLPVMMSGIIQLSVSNKRIREFLLADEIDTSTIIRIPKLQTDSSGISAKQDQNYCAIEIENGTFSWTSPEEVVGKDFILENVCTTFTRPSLTNINLNIKANSLTAIVGKVGEGKSSLISAMLGEMSCTQGYTILRGSVAYVPQQAWIQNMSIRDNITFSKKYEQKLFDKVVNCCALQPDFEILPNGDFTEIGEKGINLSGGQKQRVSLARAVYQQADINIFDDPLSAVDAHVGRHIFDKVIGPNGILKNSTRVLVTHGLTYLQKADQIVVIKQGQISEIGSYEELTNSGNEFSEILKTYLENSVDKALVASDTVNEDGHIFKRSISLQPTVRDSFQPPQNIFKSEVGSDRSHNKFISDDSPKSIYFPNQSELSPQNPARLLRRFTTSDENLHYCNDSLASEHNSSAVHENCINSIKRDTDHKIISMSMDNTKVNTKLIEEEVAAVGRVKGRVFLMYFKAIGYIACIIIALGFIFGNGLKVGSSVWLSMWSDDTATQLGDSNSNKSSPSISVAKKLGVYTSLGIGSNILIFGTSLFINWFAIKASVNLHRDLLHSLIRAPMAFFDGTPLGRIITRFGKDVDTMDYQLPEVFREFVRLIILTIANIVVIIAATPIFAAVIVPLALVYYFIQRLYIASTRQIKRMESIAQSPIYSHFQESIQGSTSIRSYGAVERFIKASWSKVDAYNQAYYQYIVSNRFMGVAMQFIGNIITFFASIFAVANRSYISAGLAGLSISNAMNINLLLDWAVRMLNEIETNIISVERIQEYSETTPEATWDIADTNPPLNWPDRGAIQFVNHSARYRDGLDLVLRNFSCEIRPMEKIGIVGRTGAGKSSLTLSLYRLIEPASGKILIDGIDISTLGLHQLRSRLTIIPQEPVLFSGSVRLNLDPLHDRSDAAIWSALSHAHLAEHIKTLPDGLNHEISEGGENLSVGQRQLICLARALLRKTKILILDEATAAVDLETDSLIQQTIRSEFNDCTILTIAHRLNTIMECNRILVLEGGKIIEFDSPCKLLANKTSVFFGMAKEAGLAS